MAGRQVIVAGVGCRRGCTAEAIVAVVQQAALQAECHIDALAAPDFKRDEPGLHGAAAVLGLRIVFVDVAALANAQATCVTHSALAMRETGIASIAEGAAVAASGGRLILPRIGGGAATCAIAGP